MQGCSSDHIPAFQSRQKQYLTACDTALLVLPSAPVRALLTLPTRSRTLVQNSMWRHLSAPVQALSSAVRQSTLLLSRCQSCLPTQRLLHTASVAARHTQASLHRQRAIQQLYRPLHTTRSYAHGEPPDPNAPDVHITFVEPDGTEHQITGKAGQDLMTVAHDNDVELEGACEGSLACSTCHVVLPHEYYDKLEEPSDEENDMLDMAFGLTETSRLGCQVKLTTDMEGLVAKIPEATRNMAVDGHRPTPH